MGHGKCNLFAFLRMLNFNAQNAFSSIPLAVFAVFVKDVADILL